MRGHDTDAADIADGDALQTDGSAYTMPLALSKNAWTVIFGVRKPPEPVIRKMSTASTVTRQ